MSEMYGMETTMEPMESYEGTVEYTDEEGNDKGLTPWLIAGGVTLVGAAVVGVRALMKKAKDKPKKQKTKLKLFARVPVEETVDEEVEEIEEDIVETGNEEK